MFLGFGEIMARIAPPGTRRWRQALPGAVEVTWGGGEANVCAALALWGQSARYMTALPRHPVSESLVASLRGVGVDVGSILYRAEGRLGLYFVEVGANQRGSTVLYDRAHSAISQATADEFPFARALEGVHWLHVTGITPAISETAYHTNLALVRAAKERGVTVSCDLNFRKKLWNWQPPTPPRELARACMADLMPLVDLVIANEEDAADVLNIHARDVDVQRGEVHAEAYVDVAQQVIDRYPNVGRVAITLRQSISADHNNWGGMLYEASRGKAFFAPLNPAGAYQPWEIRDIVDRVGAGDSFAAGMLYALNDAERSDPQRAIQFAVAASCLKHSITGDFAYVTVAEIDALAAGNASGRVQR